MNIALYVIAGWIDLGGLLTIGIVGKPRKPLTSGLAVYTVAVIAAEVTILVIAAGRL